MKAFYEEDFFMLSIIGLVTILLIVALLLHGKLIPVIPLVLIPIVAAFATGFNFAEIGEFFNEGISGVINVVIMFIFAILYFGIMQNAGLFDPLIRKMIDRKSTRLNSSHVSISYAVFCLKKKNDKLY